MRRDVRAGSGDALSGLNRGRDVSFIKERDVRGERCNAMSGLDEATRC